MKQKKKKTLKIPFTKAILIDVFLGGKGAQNNSTIIEHQFLYHFTYLYMRKLIQKYDKSLCVYVWVCFVVVVVIYGGSGDGRIFNAYNAIH